MAGPWGAVLPAPFGLLRDAVSGVEQAGRALLGQERVRLAVTGLTRAGKTVFLTSLVANLLAAGRGRRTLPALEAAAGGRLRRVRLVPADAEAVPRFDVHEHLAALAADPPRWPARTEDLSTLELTLVVDRQGLIGPLFGPRTVTLELLDYPGEWLLDLPMLDQDFPSWSAETLARLRAPERLPATREFLDFVDALPPEAPGEEALARRGFALYREALRASRDRLGFRFLQPGRALNPGPRGEPPMLWFFPLPQARAGGLATLLARRHASYVADQRDHFFDPFFRRFQRQVVLVDVLGALHAGEAAFRDTEAALAAIAGALRQSGGWVERLLGLGAAHRVAFAATKADHVPERQRAALTALLRHLVAAPEPESSVHAIAAIRCTEEDVVTMEGRAVGAVRGVLKDGRIARFWPGEVPLSPPGPGFWKHPFFEMPEFQPPRLDPAGGAGIPHLGMDALLAWLIGDLL
ncbi:MAG TPA: YcjX family protein [Crenalkalicoccus sp.]|nr:YcjX family protein [Crenalkalicoccus sp.]